MPAAPIFRRFRTVLASKARRKKLTLKAVYVMHLQLIPALKELYILHTADGASSFPTPMNCPDPPREKVNAFLAYGRQLSFGLNNNAKVTINSHSAFGRE